VTRPRLVGLALLALACKGEEPEPTGPTGPAATATPLPGVPMPEDIDSIDFASAFDEAVALMVSVDTLQPWAGHTSSLATRQAGCPDFWTGPYLEGGVEVSYDEGISWRDDCIATDGSEQYYDGWIWWDGDVVESGDPASYEGRVSDASRQLEGDGLVGDADGVRYEFKGEANDSLYKVEAAGYEHFIYSSTVNATVTGTDVFDPATSLTPRGYRTDLYQSITGGDVDIYEARGNVYLFEPTLQGRFDSIGVDIHLQGTLGAAPDECTLEPLGWIGLRDANAYWYYVVFLPRFEDDIVGEEYPNDPLSVCDGCGRLYVQGVEQVGKDVCLDLSTLFAEGAFVLPDPDDYVLPLHNL
jgi:hypothetical protein